MNLTIKNAVADEATLLADVNALLQAVNLPLDGVADHFSHFLLAFADEQLCGSVGLEIYGDVALLRSLAVTPAQQKIGLGKLLTEKILVQARAGNVREIVLLTTTATDFFVNNFGFAPANRADYEEKLSASPEWNLPRCASAAFLRLQL